MPGNSPPEAHLCDSNNRRRPSGIEESNQSPEVNRWSRSRSPALDGCTSIRCRKPQNDSNKTSLWVELMLLWDFGCSRYRKQCRPRHGVPGCRAVSPHTNHSVVIIADGGSLRSTLGGSAARRITWLYLNRATKKTPPIPLPKVAQKSA